MKLSNQAVGAIMMALQKSMFEMSDVTEVLRSMELDKAPDTTRWGTTNGELIVNNPPVFDLSAGLLAGASRSDREMIVGATDPDNDD